LAARVGVTVGAAWVAWYVSCTRRYDRWRGVGGAVIGCTRRCDCLRGVWGVVMSCTRRCVTVGAAWVAL
jgi:hypothetical protein